MYTAVHNIFLIYCKKIHYFSDSPRNTDVNSNPAGLVHTEGQESLTLMCVAQGNPDPTYSWLLPNGTEVDGQTLQMSNLQLNDTGNYTCHAKNGIPDANFTEAKQVTISVGKYRNGPCL